MTLWHFKFEFSIISVVLLRSVTNFLLASRHRHSSSSLKNTNKNKWYYCSLLLGVSIMGMRFAYSINELFCIRHDTWHGDTCLVKPNNKLEQAESQTSGAPFKKTIHFSWSACYWLSRCTLRSEIFPGQLLKHLCDQFILEMPCVCARVCTVTALPVNVLDLLSLTWQTKPPWFHRKVEDRTQRRMCSTECICSAVCVCVYIRGEPVFSCHQVVL